MRFWLWSLLLALSLALPAHAQQDNLSAAKKAFADGKAAFDRGDYEQALIQFRTADALAPAPNLTYNIANCYERLGRFADAAAAFERFLQQKGPPADDEDRDFQNKTRQRIETNRARATSGARPPTTPIPPPQPPPSSSTTNLPPTTPYTPYGQQPYSIGSNTPSLRLQRAISQRNRGIGLIVSGSIIQLGGIGLAVYGGVTLPSCGGKFVPDFTSSTSTTGCGPLAGLVFGGIFMALGLVLWIPGAVSLHGSLRDMKAAQKDMAQQKAEIDPPVGLARF